MAGGIPPRPAPGRHQPWDAAADYVLENGDQVTWYYTLPAETWYTVMDNYDDIDLLTWRGQTINVNVKGQKYEDTEFWICCPSPTWPAPPSP